MIKYFSFLIFSILCLSANAQNAISGHLSWDRLQDQELIVYLDKIKIEDYPDFSKAKTIAVSSVDSKGHFSFNRDFIGDKDAIYRVYVDRIETALKDTLKTEQLFLLSNSDSILFRNSGTLFSDYANTNVADREWKKFQKFEASISSGTPQGGEAQGESYLPQIRSYTKDSLQILMVKLMSIKELEAKNLLDRDIADNPEYYQALLKELKESDLERADYLFLENKLAFLNTEMVEKEYRVSRLFNILLSLVILGLLLLVFKLARRKRRQEVPLSRQESHVRDLILAGRTNKDIANELFISLNTVKTHITNIYNKLQVSGRQELLRKNQN